MALMDEDEDDFYAGSSEEEVDQVCYLSLLNEMLDRFLFMLLPGISLSKRPLSPSL